MYKCRIILQKSHGLSGSSPKKSVYYIVDCYQSILFSPLYIYKYLYMSKKFYAQTDALGFPIPGVMMSAPEVPVQDNILEITKEMHLPVHPGGLKYYIRLDEKGNILPNSLFVHYDTLDEADVVSLQQVVTPPPPPPSGYTVKVSYDNMFDPICQATTTLVVEITSGTSLANALTITGDFASLGAYYTPADPGNPMSQPPRFDIAYEVNGVKKNRYFTLTGVGVASGADPMFGLSPERICPTYWTGNLYRGTCDAALTTGTPLQVTDGTAIEVGKFYKVGSDVWLITGAGQPDGMAITLNSPVAYNTCAAALA